MIEAGSETTSMQLNNMLLGVLSNPEVIILAHEELDRVVGNERPPTFDDVAELPYIRSIVKEVMRWRPTNKFGQNHFATQVPIYPVNANHRTIGMVITLFQRGPS
jgi:cytochrome P450